MTDRGRSCHFAVRLTPRADRDAVAGVDAAGVLLVRVTAPPVDGAANEALVRLVAKELAASRTSVVIESGATARVKRLRVAATPERVRARWAGLDVRP